MDPASANRSAYGITLGSANNYRKSHTVHLIYRDCAKTRILSVISTQTNTKQNKEDKHNGNHQKDRWNYCC